MFSNQAVSEENILCARLNYKSFTAIYQRTSCSSSNPNRNPLPYKHTQYLAGSLNPGSRYSFLFVCIKITQDKHLFIFRHNLSSAICYLPYFIFIFFSDHSVYMFCSLVSCNGGKEKRLNLLKSKSMEEKYDCRMAHSPQKKLDA